MLEPRAGLIAVAARRSGARAASSRGALRGVDDWLGSMLPPALGGEARSVGRYLQELQSQEKKRGRKDSDDDAFALDDAVRTGSSSSRVYSMRLASGVRCMDPAQHSGALVRMHSFVADRVRGRSSCWRYLLLRGPHNRIEPSMRLSGVYRDIVPRSTLFSPNASTTIPTRKRSSPFSSTSVTARPPDDDRALPGAPRIAERCSISVWIGALPNARASRGASGRPIGRHHGVDQHADHQEDRMPIAGNAKIVPCLWFDDEGGGRGQALRLDLRRLRDRTAIDRYGEAGQGDPRQAGRRSVMTVEFELDGQQVHWRSTAARSSSSTRRCRSRSYCDTPGRDRLLLEQALRAAAPKGPAAG